MGDEKPPTTDKSAAEESIRDSEKVTPLLINQATEQGSTGSEQSQDSLKYPAGIYFFLIYHILNSTAKFGYQAIWALQMYTHFKFSFSKSIAVYHVFYGLKHFFSFVGCIVAESYLGKYVTIFKFSIVSASGLFFLTFASLPHLEIAVIIISIIGAILFSIGHGFIDSCEIGFGAQQFNFDKQTYETLKYFEIFAFLTNLTGIATYFAIPFLRDGFACFEQMDCYFLGYGLPTILFSIGIVVLFAGKFLYITKNPSLNMVNIVSKIVLDAIRIRFLKGKDHKKSHWLDYANETHSIELIGDIKLLLPTMKLLLPLIMFFALIEQQRSRWVLQANEMNGYVALGRILPDQMQIFNPIFLIILTPVYKILIDPHLGKIGLNGALNKMILGAILASASFFMAATVQYQINLKEVKLPSSQNSQLRVINGIRQCDYNIKHNIPEVENFVVKGFDYYKKEGIDVHNYNTFIIEFDALSKDCPPGNITYWQLKDDDSLTVYLFEVNNWLVNYTFYLDLQIQNTKYPVLHILSQVSWHVITVTLHSERTETKTKLRHPHEKINQLRPDIYDISIDGVYISKEDLKLGGIYVYIVDQVKYESKLHTIVPSNSISVLWQLPQMATMELSEVIILFTGVEFSYINAPFSLKSVMHAYWFLIISAGSFLIILIDSLTLTTQFFKIIVFAILMLIASVIMYYLSKQFKKDQRFNMENA